MADDLGRIRRQAASSAITRLWDALVPLGRTCVFLQTGAHPDDETSAMLAALARRDGVRVGYACAVRGEGGQNAIGTESGDALGVLRTREMELAAAAIPMTLFWLNCELGGAIRDFGFSRSAGETFGRWGYERLLEALVGVIRRFKPDVVAPTFLDVPGQHGHHRAVTRATEVAFDLAGVPEAYPHLGPPWQTKKLYLPAWGGGGGSYDDAEPPPPATVHVDVGAMDRVHGATYAQIGQWSRAAHRCQGMGRWVEPGPETRPLHRRRCLVNVGPDEAGILDGLDVDLERWAGAVGPGPRAEALHAAHGAVEAARDAFPDPAAVAQAVHRALGATRAALAACAQAGLEAARADELEDRLRAEVSKLEAASQAAGVVVVDVEPARRWVVPGERLAVRVGVYCPGPLRPEDASVRVVVPPRWRARGGGGVAPVLGERAVVDVEVEVPADEPYFHPYAPSGPGGVLVAEVAYTLAGERAHARAAPAATLAVVPPLSLRADPARAVLNLARPGTLTFEVEWRRLGEGPLAAALELGLPAGWGPAPASAPTELSSAGDVATTPVVLEPPADLRPGRYTVGLRARGVPRCEHTVTEVAYEHIAASYLVEPATLEIGAMAVAVPDGVQVGYVDGGSDRGWHWLRQLGVEVTLLASGDLSRGDLGRFSAIVLGITACATRPELDGARARLHAWVEAGGHLVTQYQRPGAGWAPERTPPRRLVVGQPSIRWRVTDPDAPVRVLEPDHPLLTRPNRIDADDWQGWVRERGLYFASEWDDAYRPLLSMGDPDEAPLAGALLSARCGRGRHTHVALALHHQLEALVPGAFRLLANLVAC